MTRGIIAVGCGCAIFGLAWAQDDVLRFVNGDQVHGKWQGMASAEVLRWSTPEALEPVEWKTAQLRHLVRPLAVTNGLTESALVCLINGDVLPGTVVDMDDRELRLESPVLGAITVRRDQVREIQPAPFPGKLLYAGPFTAEGWVVTSLAEQKSEQGNVQKGSSPVGEAKVGWQHIGAAWYHVKGEQVLKRESCLEARSVLRFRLSWKERLAVNIALYADFAARAGGDNQEESPLFGNAWVLNLYQTYFSLNRTGYHRDGKPLEDRSQHAPSSVRLAENGEAEFELRMDRERGVLLLYIDGAYAAQWEQLEAVDEHGESINQPLGTGFALHCPTATMPLCFSECLITQWNGLRDSAMSRVSEDLDVVMMNNGMDRLAGKALDVRAGVLRLSTIYGELPLKMSDVASLHFARQTKLPARSVLPPRLPGSCQLRFYPQGCLNVSEMRGGEAGLQARHPLLGVVNVQAGSLLMMDFDDDMLWLEPHDRPPVPKRDKLEEAE